MTTAFTVPGRPATKGSTVSFLGDEGRVVTKTDSVGLRAWTRDVGWSARVAGVSLAGPGVPVRVHATFRFPCPKNVVRQYPTVRPDLDKLLRALLDALTGIAYADDAQVVEVLATKVYAGDTSTTVTVTEVTR